VVKKGIRGFETTARGWREGNFLKGTADNSNNLFAEQTAPRNDDAKQGTSDDLEFISGATRVQEETLKYARKPSSAGGKAKRVSFIIQRSTTRPTGKMREERRGVLEEIKNPSSFRPDTRQIRHDKTQKSTLGD